MSRPALALIALGSALLGGALWAQGSQDPHLDRRLVSGGCNACHKGHGEPTSPMLPAAQSEVCLACHGSKSSLTELVQRGALAADVRPLSLAATLALPFVHPISEDAYSARAEGVVTCTSCHSPHRGGRQLARTSRGSKRISPKDPLRFEYETCQSCHGDAGVLTQNLLDLSRLLSPESRSYHPIEAEAAERAPSVPKELVRGFVSCSDCHGNSDPAGPAGPHGSQFPYILRLEYVTADGTQESESTYALCYDCHDRGRVLDSPRFPEHRRHVVELATSCATCHSAHGSVENRALVRFSEETYLAGVAPSIGAGRLGFDSMAPGSGACYLVCHGVDHAPEVYGGASATFDAVPRVLPPPLPGPDDGFSRLPSRRGQRSRPPREAPPPP